MPIPRAASANRLFGSTGLNSNHGVQKGLGTMKTKVINSVITAMLFAGVGFSADLQFNMLNLNGNFTLDGSADISGFPLGPQTYLGNVPFDQTDAYGQVWNASYSDPAILNILMDIPDATGFYSLINTWWGQDASVGSFAAIAFGFSDDSSFTVDLYGNQDIRDFNNPGSEFTTTINGTTTLPVYQNTSGASYFIDRQWFDFSLYGDAGKTLTSVTFTDTGAWGFQRFLVSGATVQSGVEGQVTGPMLTSGQTGTPEPATFTLAGLALTAVAMIGRRRKLNLRKRG
jgi:hypothetical protein